jgi:3-deoxy-D-manno-octulosonic-acid transferase
MISTAAPRPTLLHDGSTSDRLAYAGYDAAGVLALLLCIPASPYLWWRGFGGGLKERLGRVPETLRRLPQRPVWVHAASVGESLAAAPLVAELRRRRPEFPIVASTTTLTGQAVARTEMKPDVATLLPVDALRVVDRVLRDVRPRCLILVETEIWPGLLRAAEHVGCPAVMVSGRVSPRSVRRYQWVRPLIRAALQRVSRFGMQTNADAERIIALGAPAERVSVTGNLKGGRTANVGAGPAPVGGLEGRSILIAASTQPGEEEFVLAACHDLLVSRPNLLLLIAPRRPERFAVVAELLEQSGKRYERRTAMRDSISPQTQILLLDTLGELARFLPSGLAVFVGGSVAPLGGHNVLEPAAYGKPVTFGPHVETVADAAEQLCHAGGAVMVREPGDLTGLWNRLLDQPDSAQDMGRRARAVAEEHSKAVERTWTLIEPYLRHGNPADSMALHRGRDA